MCWVWDYKEVIMESLFEDETLLTVQVVPRTWVLGPSPMCL